jgi:hypothetical protein
MALTAGRRRVVTAADRLDSAHDVETGKKHVQAIAEEIYRRLGEEGLEQIGRLKRISMWQQAAKVKQTDGTDEIQVTDLHGFQLAPSWDEGPQWTLIQPPPPVKVTPSKAKPRDTEYKTTVILPDPQIGYWRIHDTGELIPMHDEAAMDVAIQIIRHVQPESVVNLGDTMDMSEWTTKFVVQPEFVMTTQPALDRTQTFLADQRANMPADLEDPRPVKKLLGNHDERLAIAIAQNAKAALRLKKANTPDSWPVMSLQNLLDTDAIGVEISAGYPAGKFLIARGNRTKTPLYAIHGKKLDVVKVAKESRQSYIQGHLHHIAEHHMTYELHGEPLHVVAISAGLLGSTTGKVVGFHSGQHADGTPAQVVENWQQAVVIVHEYPDGYWTHQIVEIHDGRAMLGTTEFVSDIPADFVLKPTVR